MKNLCILFSVMLFVSCTLPPKPIENDARSQVVNTNLVCAKEVNILPLSINGMMAPEDAFNYSMNKIKKYTTDNMLVHPTVNVTLEPNTIDPFIRNFGKGRGITELTQNDTAILLTALNKLPKDGSSIVLIYTPQLTCPVNPSKKLRGLAFQYAGDFNVVAYNAIAINDSPVISDNQAWKIVLTHEIGHRLGIPASSSHNKSGHCTHHECVLNSGPDWKSVVSVLFNGMPYDFCEVCQAEIAEKKKMCREMNADIIYDDY